MPFQRVPLTAKVTERIINASLKELYDKLTTIEGSTTDAAVRALTSGQLISVAGILVDFVNIPTWVKRITMILSGVSTNGTANWLVQIGTASGIETTNYSSAPTYSASSSTPNSSTSGFLIAFSGYASSTATLHGHVFLTNISGNVWVASHCGGSATNGASVFGGGSKTLSGVLSRVRLATANGTDTFDAGTLNILYE